MAACGARAAAGIAGGRGYRRRVGRCLLEAFREGLKEQVTSKARTSPSNIVGRGATTMNFKPSRPIWLDAGLAAIAATGGTISAQAARAATSTIPIVVNVGDDPIRSGLVASFNRPSGNITGVNTMSPALETKRLGLLRELVPSPGMVAVLLNAANPRCRSTAASHQRRSNRGRTGIALFLCARSTVLCRRFMSSNGAAAPWCAPVRTPLDHQPLDLRFVDSARYTCRNRPRGCARRIVLVGRVLSAGKSVHIVDAQTNRHIAALAARGGVHTMLACRCCAKARQSEGCFCSGVTCSRSLTGPSCLVDLPASFGRSEQLPLE